MRLIKMFLPLVLVGCSGISFESDVFARVYGPMLDTGQFVEYGQVPCNVGLSGHGAIKVCAVYGDRVVWRTIIVKKSMVVFNFASESRPMNPAEASILDHTILVGMTGDDVIRSWGRPDNWLVVHQSKPEIVVWFYSRYNLDRARVTITDSKVTEVASGP